MFAHHDCWHASHIISIVHKLCLDADVRSENISDGHLDTDMSSAQCALPWCHTNVINKVHAVLPGGNGDDEEDNDGNGGGFNHCYCNSQTRVLVVIQQGQHVYEGVLRLNVKIIPR